MSVNVRAGDLDRRITIQRRSTTRDTYGQQVTTWTDVFSCWASIQPVSGRELVAANAVESALTHTVTILYRPTITPAMRVVYQGRLMNIQSVIDINTEHVALQLLCSEGLNEG